MRANAREHTLDRRGIAHIESDAMAVRQKRRFSLGSGCISIEQEHLRTRLVQQACAGQSDAAGPACDDGDATIEPERLHGYRIPAFDAGTT
jgi:hypothetical protein